MIKVVGCWELGWSTPIMEFDLWTYPLRDFSVDEHIMTPVSGIDSNVTEVKSIQEAIDDNPGLIPVYVDEDGDTPLTEFEHPENALYIFGKANYSPFATVGKKGVSVRIETKEHGLLWPHQAACIVLYDRFLKNDCSRNR